MEALSESLDHEIGSCRLPFVRIIPQLPIFFPKVFTVIDALRPPHYRLQFLAAWRPRKHRLFAAGDQLFRPQIGQHRQIVSAAVEPRFETQRIVLQGNAQGIKNIDAFPGVTQLDEPGKPANGIIGFLRLGMPIILPTPLNDTFPLRPTFAMI